MKFTVFLLLLFFASKILVAQSTTERRSFQLETTTLPVKIDGVLDELCWQRESLGIFWGNWPQDTLPAKNQTEVRVCHDEKFLYISAICWQDNSPITHTLKRDQHFWASDGFSVVIDPTNSKNNAVLFGLNAFGGQTDVSFSQSDWNEAWDSKWFGATQQADGYWTAEMAIPLKTLRFVAGKPDWGINFIRNDMTGNEFSTWAPVPRFQDASDLGRFGEMHWNHPPTKNGRNMVLNPYLSLQHSADFEENQYVDLMPDAGIDAKASLNSSLNLDLTINPDFSQVDVDDQQINLSQYSLFLPEKRGFFLENSDIFNGFGTYEARPFYSRRIGLNDGEAIPILYGLRLTGNLSPKWRIGMLNSHTQAKEELPSKNFTALAMSRRFWKRSSLRAMLTNVQGLRNVENPSSTFSRNMAVELEMVNAKGTLMSHLKAHGTFANEINAYGNLFSGYFGIHKPKYSIDLNLEHVDENYQTDMGFSIRQFHYDPVSEEWQRVGYEHSWIEFRRHFLPKKSTWINAHRLIVNNNMFFEQADALFDRHTEIRYVVEGTKRHIMVLRASSDYKRLLFPLELTENGEFLPVGEYNFQGGSIYLQSDDRKPLSLSAYAEGGTFFNGEKISLSGELNFRIQPFFSWKSSVQYNDIQLAKGYGDAKIWLFNTKLEFCLRKNLFWTNYLQYNTQGENVNINSRLQWRYRPMSDLFIVYSDNYLDQPFSPKNRSLVIRLNYWFSI